MKPLILLAVVIAIIAGFNSLYVVRENERAVLFQVGRIIEADIRPGLHFKLPFVQEVRLFDKRIMTLDSRPERYLTAEKKDVSVDFFAKWFIEDVARFYQATGGDLFMAEQRLTPIVQNALRIQINERTLQDVVSSERADLGEVLLRSAGPPAAGLGITLVDIRIKRIELPEDSDVLLSVFERMRAERKQIANELRAEGQEASERIRSNADRQRVVLVAEAERDGQRMRGEGDARAAEIYAQAFGSDAEFYAFYRSLEAYRRAFQDGSGVMVLDPRSEFFEYFGDQRRDRR
ncbi:MAG TPA: protease modulator HflC [Xanthomonadaceae bacterium]|nr:protease modulator HflC [Xanthomonadaceae bacterium]